MQKQCFRRWARAALVGLALLGLAACSASDEDASQTLTVGSADFAESQLIATIYADALQQAGMPVAEKLNIGSREVYLKALQDGSIDLVPEYNGMLLLYFDPDAHPAPGSDLEAALDKALPEGLTALDAAPAQDQDGLVVTQKFAAEHHLEKISDLTPTVAAEMTLAGPPEWKVRPTGVPGFKKVYGITFKDFKVLDAGGPLTLAALVNGQAQAGNLFTSDPAVRKNGLVTLSDDKGLFTEARIIPIMRSDKATPEVRKVLDQVSAALSQQDLVAMNSEINAGKDIDTIATDWLKSKGLN